MLTVQSVLEGVVVGSAGEMRVSNDNRTLQKARTTTSDFFPDGSIDDSNEVQDVEEVIIGEFPAVTMSATMWGLCPLSTWARSRLSSCN